MSEWIVTGTSMITEADTADEAIERAEQSSGWHWEAQEVTPTPGRVEVRREDAGRPVHMPYALSAGELIDFLSRYPRETPLLGYGAADYLNITGVNFDPAEDIAIVIETADDYESRQF